MSTSNGPTLEDMIKTNELMLKNAPMFKGESIYLGQDSEFIRKLIRDTDISEKTLEMLNYPYRRYWGSIEKG